MSEKLPFEENMEQQFNKLQLPDEEQSWQKMKAMLDDEDRKRRPIFFLLSCLGWGLLFLGLSAGAYFLFFNNKTSDDKTSKTKIETSSHNRINQNDDRKSSDNPDMHSGQSSSSILIESRKPEPGKLLEQNSAGSGNKNLPSEPGSIREVQNPLTPNSYIVRKINNRNKPALNREKVVENVTSNNINDKAENAVKTNAEYENHRVANKDSLNTLKARSKQEQGEPVADSTARFVKPKEIPVTPALDSTKNKKQAEKKLFFTAGLGIQQQVPVGGQESVPYDSYGRKVSISDYIPSAFLRWHKEDKWFIMGEFRYGAPQQVNDFNYDQHSVYDTSSMTLATTTMRLKKTYYHQLPLSFNYYVKPGWSVGLGAMYSRFYGAVTEKEVKNYNVYTQDISYSKTINNVRGFTDSFLHKTQVHFIVNTDYQYKNFLLGLRFTKDIQPYIKYTTPDGIKNEEKNYSLQVILRWQIWKSRK